MIKVTTEHLAEIKKSDEAKQIVYGEVYKPDCRDSDGNWMSAETIEKMAHNFMQNLRNTSINKNHRGARDKGTVVESFIVRKGDTDFIEGSWVVGVHVPDKNIWEQVTKGELTGFSIEGTAQLLTEEENKDNEAG